MRKAVRAIVVRGDRVLVMYRSKFGQEYYTLIGGGIDAGETADQALAREIAEETSMKLATARPVFVEEAGDPYGTQYIYLCEVEGDEPRLADESEEAKLFSYGNQHTPMWLPLSDIGAVPFRSERLKKTILHCTKRGWPTKPVTLDDHYVTNIHDQKVEE